MERITLYSLDGRAFRELTADRADLGEHGPRHLVLTTGKAVTSIWLGEQCTAVIEPVEEA